MSERSRAQGYARELFDITWRHGDAPSVAQELETLVEALRRHDASGRALLHPLVPVARKVATVREFVARAGLSKPTAVLVEALVHGHSAYLLPVIAEAFRERLNQRQGVVRAKVTTASPLPADRVEALTARLSELTGRQIALDARVDPAIIGGVITQIGSTVYDGSVTRQLARMRQKLVENV